MEALYSKLYDKYTKLKTTKESESEKLNRDQEEKFITYLSAADDMIEHLKSENDRLLTQVNDLRSEVTSIRFTKDQQHAEYQKLLMEEKQRNKEAAEEIQRLRDAEQGRGCTNGDDKIENRQDNTVVGSLVGSPASGVMTRSKRKRYSGTQTEANDQLERGPVSGGLLKESISLCVQPKCCSPKIGDSTGGDIGATTCIFQELVECIVGMKLSINITTTEMDEICILAVHQSSGYSFSLTWKNKELLSLGETEEVVYRVVSLGTFEKVAPEWMREVLIFSSRMFPIFFQRVSHVINLH